MSARAASKSAPARHNPWATERSPEDADREAPPAMPQALADGPLTPNEQRFADLLALEMRAVAEGANPESLRSIAEARRAAGLTCHPVGHDISAVGPSPRRKSRRPGSLHE